MVGSMLMIKGLLGQKAAVHREANKTCPRNCSEASTSWPTEPFYQRPDWASRWITYLEEGLGAAGNTFASTDKIEILKEKIRGSLATVISTVKNRNSPSK